MIGFVKGLFEWLKCEFLNVQIGNLSMLMLKAFLAQFLIIIFCFPLPKAAVFPSPPSRPYDLLPYREDQQVIANCVWYCCVSFSLAEEKLRAVTLVTPVVRR